MAAEICTTSFHSGSVHAYVGDTADSTASIVSNNTAFWELVSIASTSVALVSQAYGTSFFNKGDTVLTANAAVTANPTFFANSGVAAAQTARVERLGGHR